MLVSVAICTWNRARLLDLTLVELRHLRVPEGVEWELLVVNNNSPDDTAAVVARHAPHLPLRALTELRQGLSHARNAAVTAARGDLVLFTDDDVLVDPDWLVGYVAAARRWPDAAYFGGLIAPFYERRPPAWVEANLDCLFGMLVLRDFGPDEAPFAEEQHPFGANMAFRRAVFARQRFDPALGCNGVHKILGEEVAFVAALREQGLQGVWVPSARVRHYVPPERLTARYLWRYFVGHGRTAVRTGGVPPGRPLFGAPRWLYADCAALLGRSAAARLRGSPQWVELLARAAHLRGMIAECRAAGKPGRLALVGGNRS